MAVTRQEAVQPLSSLKDEFLSHNFWTPPATDPLALNRKWNDVREFLSLRQKLNIYAEPLSEWPYSRATETEDHGFRLEPYGITIVDTIRRMEYGDVFCDQESYKGRSEEACKLVVVSKDELYDLVPEISEIRDRYRYHKMFTSLMESHLFKPTPLSYNQAFGHGLWRPERCIDLGGQELEWHGWRFPPRVKPPSEDENEEEDGRARPSTEKAYSDYDVFSDQNGLVSGKDGEQHAVAEATGTKEANGADLTVENLRALHKANAAADKDSDRISISQFDGVLELASADGQIDKVKPGVAEGIKTRAVNPDAMAVVLFESLPAQRSRLMALVHKFLSGFGRLWPVKRSESRPAQQMQHGHDNKNATNNNPDFKDTNSTTTNLDPFKEDDPSTKYLTTPFETERYHILSKQQGPQNPYHLDHPVHFPGHPALHGLMHSRPNKTPWRAPAVSYWCRPVIFDPEVLASKLDNLDQANTAEGPDSTRADKKFRSAAGLNNVTCPYLSVTYADVTGCFGDLRGYRRTTNQALTDLCISMTTAVHNSFLVHLAGSGSGGIHGEDVAVVVGEIENQTLSSESISGSETEIGVVEDGNEDRLRHYGICINLRGYSCWVAEPKLNLQVAPPPAETRTTKDEQNPAGFQHLPASEPLPRVDIRRDTDTVTKSDSVTCTDAEAPENETNNTSFSKMKSASQRECEWAGCTITKVAEGRLDKYMDLDVLVEFINRAHEYGMGSFVAGVAADLGVIAETEPEEAADRKEVGDGKESENEWDASTCGIGAFDDDTSGVYDDEQLEDAQLCIDGAGDRFGSSRDEVRGDSRERW